MIPRVPPTSKSIKGESKGLLSKYHLTSTRSEKTCAIKAESMPYITFRPLGGHANTTYKLFTRKPKGATRGVAPSMSGACNAPATTELLLHCRHVRLEVVLILSAGSAQLKDDGCRLHHAVGDLLRLYILRRGQCLQWLHCIQRGQD